MLQCTLLAGRVLSVSIDSVVTFFSIPNSNRLRASHTWPVLAVATRHRFADLKKNHATE